MIPESGILVQHVVGSVPIINAAHTLENVLFTAIPQVRERDSVTLLQVSKSAGSRHFLKSVAFVVAKHPVRRKERQLWVTRANVEIRPAVVVQIAKVNAHAPHELMDADLRCHVRKCSVPIVMV